MQRFFVSPASIDGDRVTLTGDVARQLARVLRLHPGERIVVLDDSGWEYVIALDHVTPRDVRGAVVERLPSRGEPGVEVTLYMALLKSDRFELVLQKGTELGVSVFVPVLCHRSVRDRGGSATRYQRWRRIIAEAAEQSGRGRLPTLESPCDFSVACEAVDGPALIPWEEERETGLKAALKRWSHEVSALSVFIGPEGGFTGQEIETARARGIVPVGLGDRTLRAETAAVATVAAILYELGELGG